MNTRVKTWLVFVRDVGDSHVAFVQRYGFWPTKKRGIFWRRFDSPENAKHAIQPFVAAGLHGIIQNKWRDAPAYKPRQDGMSAANASAAIFAPYQRNLQPRGTSRSSGFSAAPKSSSNKRRRGRGRRGL